MNIKEFKESLDYLFEAQVTPFVWGHAGIGKSSTIKQYADSKGFHFFPLYLGTQSDLGDILGLAEFIKDDKGNPIATTFAPPIWLVEMIEYCNANPDSGAILFLDEFNRARRDILSGIFSLALDKTFHTIKLPKNCHVIAAGNPPTDEYFVTDVNETALMARFVHIRLEPSFDEFISFAKANDFNRDIIGFLQEHPNHLSGLKSEFELPVKVDNRSYERLNRFFKIKTPQHLMEHIMIGIIGPARTVAYQAYLQTSDKPLSGDEVLEMTPNTIVKLKKWANKDDILASLISATSDNVFDALKSDKLALTHHEQSNVCDFLGMIPKDMAYVLIKRLMDKRNAHFMTIIENPTFEKTLIDLVKTARGLKHE